ncbi:MAG: hypothetical protein JXR76_14070 [Deltaproteobacteria bacterium]|nr:hypothetical protein [Deltaproteobacteria bacterium]
MTAVRHIPARLESIRYQPDSIFFGFLFEDNSPLQGTTGLLDWRLLGQLSKLKIANQFSGKWGESLLVLPGNRVAADYVVLIGAGKKADFNKEINTGLLKQMLQIARRLFAHHMVLSLPGRNENLISGEEAVSLFFETVPPLLPLPEEISFRIIDVFEVQSVVSAHLEQYHMQNAAPLVAPL